MADKMVYINPALLVWARESSGTTLKEARSKFGEEKLTKWENGEDHPTYPQLKAIGSYYRKPIAVFFFPEIPRLKSIPASFRTLPESISNAFSREVMRTIDWARTMQINVHELHNGENPSTKPLTKMSFDISSINATASQLRMLLDTSLLTQKHFHKREEAFEYWREVFLRAGVYVFKNAFKDNSISGFCIYDNEFPVICINNSLAFSRQIFTLFHEVYHLIRGISGADLLNDYALDNDIERMCNEFAGTFLVPDEDFLSIVLREGITDQKVEKWADLYSVSREVILRKLLNHRLIKQETYDSKRDELYADYFRMIEEEKDPGSPAKQGGGNYYFTQVSYKGQRYVELAYGSYYTKKISITQLAHYMDMKIPSIRALASMKGWGEI